MFKRLIAGVALAGAAVLGAATSAQAGPTTPLDRTLNAGWSCGDIAGAMHCFDPGDGKSSNAKSVNVKVYTYAGEFLGTEQIWILPVSGKRLCPQDQLLIVPVGPFGSLACHHYEQ